MGAEEETGLQKVQWPLGYQAEICWGRNVLSAQ